MNDKKNVWAVLGMPNEAKDKAKILAKKQKKNIGEWLGQVILSQESSDGEAGAGGSSYTSLHTRDNSSFGSTSMKPTESTDNSVFGQINGIIRVQRYLDSIDKKLDDLTTQMATIAVQIYDLKINPKFKKKSFWDRFV